MKVELHIEELVLEGFDARHRHRIRDAVERELTRLLGEGRGDLQRIARDTQTAQFSTSFRIEPTPVPERVGVNTAQSIYDAVVQKRVRGRSVTKAFEVPALRGAGQASAKTTQAPANQ